ncbi:MAG: hypothetical protein ABS87_01410 [Sphingomonas sp. SCN 67-18]|uniref:Rid family hydrolase n=1 Tax=uncultured Sphingomonas sp. TaxID=158754 RepID=UPI00086BB888|nr:Rid family hydrolase [Sphingomonas sp. SCN 67-18]ODU22665.1 MAG: hypothetical protein ABS87_01410 [Sphingomonas sp. SCN 67-18]
MRIIHAVTRGATAAVLATLFASSAGAEGIVRVMPPDAPIATSAAVPAKANLIFLSGLVASPIDPSRPDELGDTRRQTLDILTRMKAQIEGLGSSMGSIVKMTVFLVGVPENGGRMDRAAMNEVFRTFFGSADQPNKPTRSTVQVAGLGSPNVLVEIEAIAADMP